MARKYQGVAMVVVVYYMLFKASQYMLEPEYPPALLYVAL